MDQAGDCIRGNKERNAPRREKRKNGKLIPKKGMLEPFPDGKNLGKKKGGGRLFSSGGKKKKKTGGGGVSGQS